MKALIDADIFQYEFGNATDDEGRPLPWPLVQSRIQGRINGILEATEANSYQLYLTSDDKSNFRFKVATIKPYKGNRKNLEKPKWYYQIRNFLIDHRGAIEVFGMEADDAISIAGHENYKKYRLYGYGELGTPDFLVDHPGQVIICSRDKDLNMIPGWHYSWGAGKHKEKEMWYTNEIEGYRCFYRQLLIGDTIDNIPGLYGVGKSSKLLSDLGNIVSVVGMYDYVLAEYAKRFGSYAEQFLTENARLLWLLSYEGEIWTPPSKTEETISEEPTVNDDLPW